MFDNVWGYVHNVRIDAPINAFFLDREMGSRQLYRLLSVLLEYTYINS